MAFVKATPDALVHFDCNCTCNCNFKPFVANLGFQNGAAIGIGS